MLPRRCKASRLLVQAKTRCTIINLTTMRLKPPAVFVAAQGRGQPSGLSFRMMGGMLHERTSVFRLDCCSDHEPAAHDDWCGVFIDLHMHRIGCPIGIFHTLSEAAAEHAIPFDVLIAEIQAAIAGNGTRRAE